MSGFLNLNDNCVTLTLSDNVTGGFVNDATASVTIKDSAGAVIVSAQSMPYVAASDGIYRTFIASTVDLGGARSVVSVEVNAVAGDGSVFFAKDDTVYVKTNKLNL